MVKYPLFLTTLFFCSTLSSQQNDSLLFERGAFSIFKNKAVFLDSILYDVNADYKRILEIEEDGNTNCVEGIELYYKPLSLLTNFYSFERLRYDSGGSGNCYRNPSNEILTQTIHIKTRSKVNLLDLVEEESLVDALKGDTWVRNRVGAKKATKLNTKNTFAEVLDFINDSMGYNNAFHTYSFALHSYDERTKLLAVRLIGVEYMGYNHSKKLQLGLLLKPKEDIKSELEKKQGFFLGKF